MKLIGELLRKMKLGGTPSYVLGEESAGVKQLRESE